MKRICKISGKEFEVSEEDLAFYDKVSPVIGGKKFLIPPPNLCPEERLKRRLVWRNERGLYKRKCDKTGEALVSWISPDKPYKVYKNDLWWGDSWDAKDYGRDFDFNRPFFEQLKDLSLEVPWMGILIDKAVNSDYTNFCNNVKNCYLIYASNNNEDCMYSSYIWGFKDSLDCLQGFDCQLCYEATDCNQCYNCRYVKSCTNCSDLIFCENCQNCRNCFGCVNLVGKNFYFLNEKLSEEDYRKRLAEINTCSHKKIQEVRGYFEKYRLKFPMRGSNIVNCENCTGEALKNSKNLQESFDTSGAEDSKWIMIGSDPVKDCYDVTGCEGTELCYETVVNGLPATHNLFSAYVWKNVHNIYYCILTPGSKNCFGCMGLHDAQYCILNKQYSKEEYEKLVPRIIEYMQKTGEWGKFFPGTLSPFGYNESLANDYFPMNKEESLKSGFKWNEYEQPLPEVERVISGDQVPDDIKDIPDAVLNFAIKCPVTSKLFKVTAQELQYYRKNKIPLPRKHHEQRHKERLAKRNPRKLWERKCDQCVKIFKSTYALDRPEKVYCEECFRKEVY